MAAKLWGSLHQCQLMCILTSPLDWAWKTNPNWPLICWNPSTGCQVKGRSSSMSADKYTDLTIGLGMKNYPKMAILNCPPIFHMFIMVIQRVKKTSVSSVFASWLTSKRQAFVIFEVFLVVEATYWAKFFGWPWQLIILVFIVNGIQQFSWKVRNFLFIVLL